MKKHLLLVVSLCALALPAMAFHRDPKPFYIKVGSLCGENPQRTLADGEKEFVARGNVFGSTSQKCPGQKEEWTPDYWAVPPGTHFGARVKPDGTPDYDTLWLRQCGQPFKPNVSLNRGNPVLDPWVDPNSLQTLPDRMSTAEGNIGQLQSDLGELKAPVAASAAQPPLSAGAASESWRNRPASDDAGKNGKLAASVVPEPGFCSKERHRTGCIVTAILVGGAGAYAVLSHGGGNGGARVYRPGQP